MDILLCIHLHSPSFSSKSRPKDKKKLFSKCRLLLKWLELGWTCRQQPRPLEIPRTWYILTRPAPSLWFLKLKGNTNVSSPCVMYTLKQQMWWQESDAPLILGTIRRYRACIRSSGRCSVTLVCGTIPITWPERFVQSVWTGGEGDLCGSHMVTRGKYCQTAWFDKFVKGFPNPEGQPFIGHVWC